MECHRLHAELLRKTVEILVVGCGGNGSAIVAGLPYLHNAMFAQGHPHGLHVTVMDGDSVSPFNSVRQPFAKSEVGLNKAVVLMNRINLFWGLDWSAIPRSLTADVLRPEWSRHTGQSLRPDVVIGCVDTRAARAVIAECVSGPSVVHYYVDCGNRQTGGQFVLGEPLNSRNKRSKLRLRTVGELYPELVDSSLDDRTEPSCSALESLDRQESFVNTVLAHQTLALLARLFRYGEIAYHGAFIDVAGARSVPLQPGRSQALAAHSAKTEAQRWTSSMSKSVLGGRSGRTNARGIIGADCRA